MDIGSQKRVIIVEKEQVAPERPVRRHGEIDAEPAKTTRSEPPA